MVKTHAFQAEVSRLLELVVHSLYSNKEIFLRELVSNAADALDKLRFRAVTETSLASDVPLGIVLRPDAEAKTLSIEDTGCGMTEEELVQFLGTVAHSGSRELYERLSKAGEAKDLSLIGQFGVGFYSAFLVADHVDVISRAAGQETAFKWSSDAKSSFTIEPAERATHGTTVRLHLKDEHAEFLEQWRLRSLVERYSDYVPYPVSLVTKSKDGAEEQKQLNRGTALWQRPRAEVTDEQHDELYKHLTHDHEKALARSHFKIEGTLEFTGLLYLPRRAPMDLFDPQKAKGLRLFVKRVLIMEDCADILPQHLRFVRGVVDSDDLPLNVSREILQESSALRAIRKQVTKKAVEMLEELATERPDDYVAFFRVFGGVLKEGAAMGERDEKLIGLFRFESTRTEAGTEGKATMTSLDEYVARMPEGQKEIYFLHGPNKASLSTSPYLEALAKKGYEVLLLTDPVDEFAIAGIQRWKDKELVSATRAELDLGETDEEKKAREATKTKLEDLLARAMKALDGRVSEVRLSDRLTESPSCLVIAKGGTPLAVEAMLRAAGRPVPENPRIFELNGGHPLVEKLAARLEASPDDDTIVEYIEVLYEQAKLAEGGAPDDPGLFGRRVAKLLALGL